ncbi:protein of unknown function [Candidatus Hydrogenisulfobacillus filiaventi]|uniref:Uncharacterized protein n=1 Tax=Candidatus Hydrogenisulfobacillus filiaventi TaxID=2707344 RepID=A0A6F8ZHM2_9FIRM|nr:protein of unknown function [Candidatus Hydrogenisulfobacillus filiaventi]
MDRVRSDQRRRAALPAKRLSRPGRRQPRAAGGVADLARRRGGALGRAGRGHLRAPAADRRGLSGQEESSDDGDQRPVRGWPDSLRPLRWVRAVHALGALPAPPACVGLPTQAHWRSSSRLEDLGAGLRHLVEVDRHRARGVRSLAVPAPGTDLGGLAWGAVEPTLCGWLGRLAMPMALYGPEAHRTREPEPGRGARWDRGWRT